LGGQLEGVDYVELRSPGTSQDEQLPMIVALHSHGMTAEKMAELASHVTGRVRVIAPSGFEEAGLGRAWTTERDDDPQYATALGDAAAQLVNFLDAIQQCRPTVGKPIVAGYSAGADLAFALAVDAPQHISAAVGAAGWLPPEFGPVGAALTAVHGRDDTAAPYERTALEIEARDGKGEPVTLVPMTGVGHSIAGALQLRWLQAMSEAARAASSSPA
jgi:phospholipase/carboxylesterase